MNDPKMIAKFLREANIGPIVSLGYIEKAADAIEQLVKERDAAVADIEEVIHDDFGEICTICNKYKSCMKTTAKTLLELPCERGKWRGVKEE